MAPAVLKDALQKHCMSAYNEQADYKTIKTLKQILLGENEKNIFKHRYFLT